MISGVGSVALTKLDVLDGLEEIKICVGYRLDGEELRSFPARWEALEKAQPVYETFPGWQEATAGVLSFDDLPTNARAYIATIEKLVGAPVGVVSTGPRREETILRKDPVLSQLMAQRHPPLV
jgi:adenylosuccinate synthase